MVKLAGIIVVAAVAMMAAAACGQPQRAAGPIDFDPTALDTTAAEAEQPGPTHVEGTASPVATHAAVAGTPASTPSGHGHLNHVVGRIAHPRARWRHGDAVVRRADHNADADDIRYPAARTDDARNPARGVAPVAQLACRTR